MDKKGSKLDLRRAIAMAIGAGTASICLCLPALSQADTGTTDTSTPVKIKKVVKTVPPEKAVATVSKTKVEHTSPTTNMLTLLRNVPGFNVVSSGPANLVSTNSAFSLNGFGSSEIGTTFDGVPIINTVRGGVYGAGSDHALTPLTMGQIGSVEVYSGANTPRQNSLDSLGGTVNFMPKEPSDKAGVDLMFGTGSYSTTGYSTSYGVTGNTGSVAALDGLKAIASYTHTKTHSFQKNVYANLNSYYLNVTQPFNEGLSKLSFILTHNDETAQTPVTVPIALVEAYGRAFQYPRDVFWNSNKTHATHMIISLESFLNPYMEGGFKLFYNDSYNDRTQHVDPTINNSYMGYPLPMHTQSAFALSGYGSNFNTYDAATATALFGSAAAGTQYQRYLDHYYNVGGKGHLTFLLPSNTVTIGGMMFSAKNVTTTDWYGAEPVPIIGGYNDAWLEHDGLDYAEGYIQDNISLLKGKVHIYPGVKYVHTQPSVTDIQGYY
ncbi:TonB-dependent receptor plug domain-containing protein [Acidihalobacter aeolianus]|nr:TonB-dependent receptor plug domain-containing protein [Acidihalobacter aeolianus]